MAKYKVIALSVGGRGNRIFNSGDIVTDDNFPGRNAGDLVAKGFLEKIDDDAKVDAQIEQHANQPETDGDVQVEITEVEIPDVNTESPETTNTSNTPQQKNFVDANGKRRTVKTIEDITKKELINELEIAQVDFDSVSKKEVLFDIWFKL